MPELPGPGVAADGDGWLPGFDPGPGPLAKLPALDFLHAGGLEAFQRGRGAPWPLRIAYETLIDVPAATRNGGISCLEYPLRGDGDATLQAMLYPEGRLKLSRDWGRFLAALEVVDRFSVPADDGMSAWLPIRVRSVPMRTGGVLRRGRTGSQCVTVGVVCGAHPKARELVLGPPLWSRACPGRVK